MPPRHWLEKPHAGLSLLAIPFFVSLLRSYWPPRDNPDDIPWLELENNLELASSERSSNQLIAVTVSFVPVDFEVAEETFHGLIESDAMSAELVLFKIIFEVRGREPMPIDHPYILLTCVMANEPVIEKLWKPALPRSRLGFAALTRPAPRPPGSPTLQFYQFRYGQFRPPAASAAECA